MSRASYVAGLRAVEQLMETGSAEIRCLYAEYRSANPRVTALVDRALTEGVEVQHANRARLGQMSGDARHQGVVAEVRRNTVLDEAGLRSLVEERLQAAGDRQLAVLLLDGVQDPHNLGACMRTAEAAGVDALVAPRHGAAGLSPAVSKVAAGAAEILPFAQVPSLLKVLDWLGAYGVLRLGTSDRASVTLWETDLDRPLALVMGGEEAGLGKAVEARLDRLVALPMHGSVDSLNVSVATGVCLYEMLRQRQNPEK